MSQASPPQQRARLPLWSVVAIVVLSGLVTVAAALPSPRPERSMTSFWQVSDVPAALWILLLGVALACIAVAVALTVPGLGLAPREPAVVAWVLLVVVAAAALVWNALYSAALSTTFYGALIPIFHWLFTLVPALLGGGFFGSRDRGTRLVAALGTGVVTVPLFHLSSVLLVPAGRPAEALVFSFTFTGTLAVVPLVVGVLMAAAPRERRADHPAS